MKQLLIGGIAALAIGAIGTPVAGADPGNDECCEHEFDWATAYYDVFERHGIGYLADEMGIPLMNQADWVCNGRLSREDIRNELHRMMKRDTLRANKSAAR